MVFPGRQKKKKKAYQVFPRGCLGLGTPNLCFLLIIILAKPPLIYVVSINVFASVC